MDGHHQKVSIHFFYLIVLNSSKIAAKVVSKEGIINRIMLVPQYRCNLEGG